MTIQNLKSRAFANPEVESEYKNLETEFELIDTLLTMRSKAGLTQEQIAKKLGTQKSNISRLERGTSNPSWKTIQNYANACGFNISMKVKNKKRHGSG